MSNPLIVGEIEVIGYRWPDLRGSQSFALYEMLQYYYGLNTVIEWKYIPWSTIERTDDIEIRKG